MKERMLRGFAILMILGTPCFAGSDATCAKMLAVGDRIAADMRQSYADAETEWDRAFRSCANADIAPALKARIVERWATVLARRGDLKGSQALLDRSLSDLGLSFPEARGARVVLLDALIFLLDRQKDYVGAEQAALEALSIKERLCGKSSENLIDFLDDDTDRVTEIQMLRERVSEVIPQMPRRDDGALCDQSS